MPIGLIMSITPQLMQFAASLVAILVLAWLVAKMGLGAPPRLADEAAARSAAGEVSDGFCAVDIALDKDGRGALLRDAAGRIMLLKPHGVHFAGRILGPAAQARREGERLAIDTGERRFGSLDLSVDNAASWEAAINGLDSAGNA